MGACSFEIDALKRCCEQDFAKGSLHCAFHSRHADSKDVVSNDDGNDDPVGKVNHAVVDGEATNAECKTTNIEEERTNE